MEEILVELLKMGVGFVSVPVGVIAAGIGFIDFVDSAQGGHGGFNSEDRNMCSRKIPVNVEKKPDDSQSAHPVTQEEKRSVEQNDANVKAQANPVGNSQNTSRPVEQTAAPTDNVVAGKAVVEDGGAASAKVVNDDEKDEKVTEVHNALCMDVKKTEVPPAQGGENNGQQATEASGVPEEPTEPPSDKAEALASGQEGQRLEEEKCRMMRDMFEIFAQHFFQTYDKYFETLFHEVSGKSFLTIESPAIKDFQQRLLNLEEQVKALNELNLKSCLDTIEKSVNSAGETANKAQKTAQEAKTEAQQASTIAKQASATASNANTAANNAQALARQATSASVNAHNAATNAQTISVQANGNASQAKKDAANAMAAAGDAAKAAESARENAKAARADADKALTQGQEILTIINNEKRENEDLIRKWLSGYQGLQEKFFAILRDDDRKKLSKEDKQCLDINICEYIKECLLKQYGQSSGSRETMVNEAVAPVLERIKGEIKAEIESFVKDNDPGMKIIQAFKSYLKKDLAECFIIPQSGDDYISELHNAKGNVVPAPNEDDDEYQIEMTMFPGISNPQNASSTVKAMVRVQERRKSDE